MSATKQAQVARLRRRVARRARRVLGRLRLNALPAGSGAAVVSRRPIRVHRIDDSTFVVSSSKGIEVHPLAPGAGLVADPQVVSRHRFDLEKAIHDFLVPQHLMQVFSIYRVNVVFDVGANKGQYGKLLREAGYDGHIVSFEPVPEVAAQLERVARKDAKWTVHAVALGREAGTTTMNVVPGTLSSVLPPTEFGAGRYDKLNHAVTYDVPVRRLDDMLDEILVDIPQPRPYLKLDTQGFDLEAFAGVGERINEFVAMQSEVAFLKIYDGMPRFEESLAAYEAAGFEVSAFYPVSRQTPTARVLEFDCVMVRASAK